MTNEITPRAYRRHARRVPRRREADRAGDAWPGLPPVRRRGDPPDVQPAAGARSQPGPALPRLIRGVDCTSLRCRSPRTLPVAPYEHPAANAFRKHEKSATFSTGAAVDPSQLAYESPAANRFRKHEKSATFRAGTAVEPSQLA